MFVDWLKLSFIGGFLFILTVCSSHASSPANRKAWVQMNTAPVGQVDVGGAPVVSAQAAAPRSGGDVYKAACSFCHDTGAAGAPQITSKAAWAARVGQGEDTLVNHAIHGYKTMPAKGGCSSCSDDEVRNAVEFILSKVK